MAAQPVNCPLNGLLPGTTYHFRLVATNTLFSSAGADAFFTTLNTNANLAALALSAGLLSPSFSPAITSYSTLVGGSVTSISVTPTSADPHATLQVRINGGPYIGVPSGTASPPLPLNAGANPIDVQVMAQDGLTFRTYTVTATLDAIPPEIISCATNRTLVADTNGLAALPLLTGEVVATDDRTSSANLVITQSPPSGTLFGPSTNVVTLSVRDEASNLATCEMTIIVADQTAPFFTTLTNLVILAESNQCGATFILTASDNCDPVPVITSVPPPGTFLPVGRANVVATAVDASGNSNTCTFTISVYPQQQGPAGEIWTPRESNRNWTSVASSEDGTKLVAVESGGRIYTSTDSGTNWIARESNRYWRSVASSADGTKLVAVVFGGQIFTSTDSGTNWIARESNRYWTSVASSADGTKLVAVVSDGQIYTSTDSGTNWTARASSRSWLSVASSADGAKLVAVMLSDVLSIFTSTDSGTNWAARASGPFWYPVASSADGTKLVAGASNGKIYTSTDSGRNWTARASSRYWYSVASSADGTKLVAGAYGGQIYTSVPAIIPTTNPPVILGATNREVDVASPEGGIVVFSVIATNTCQPYVPVTCTPSPGSFLPPGTSQVACEAVDALGVTNTATFTITVRARPSVANLGASITGTNLATGLPEASLSAGIIPNGLPTTGWFQYGLNTSYGGSTPPLDLAAGYSGSNILAALGGLLPNATYHWRVVATNNLGTTCSPDQVLSVPALFAPGDADGDGVVDQAELDAVLANYYPTSPWLFITNTAGLGGSQVIFALSNSTVGAYSVLVSTNLNDWDFLGPATPRYEFTDTNAPAEPQRFYRLRWP